MTSFPQERRPSEGSHRSHRKSRNIPYLVCCGYCTFVLDRASLSSFRRRENGVRTE